MTPTRWVDVVCSALGVIIVLTGESDALGQERPANLLNPPLSTREANSATAIFAEPRVIARGIDAATRMLGDGSDIKDGFYPDRHWFFSDQMYVDGSAAISWRTYKMTQARVELPRLARSRLAVGTHVRWQDITQITFFGEGPDSLETNRSEDRLKSTNVSAYATVRPVQWLAAAGAVVTHVAARLLRVGRFAEPAPHA